MRLMINIAVIFDVQSILIELMFFSLMFIHEIQQQKKR